MLKRTLICLAVLGALVAAGSVQARYTQCMSDARVMSNDCESNTDRPYSYNCCPDGYRVQGVAYSDIPKGADYMDAISPVCRHIKKGNTMMPTDFQREPVVHMCDKTEIMIGLACKDMPKKGKDSDISDGCTAICQNPKTKKERILYSKDLEDNGNPYVITKIYLPNRITGIHYKEWARGQSDRADCATVSYKYQPIVKPTGQGVVQQY